MRHRVSHRKLGRVTEHRIAMLRNQASALLKYEHIETTMPKAKELRPFVERIITIAKRGLAAGADNAANGRTLHARRLVLRDIQDRDVVSKLFDTIAPRFEARPGGYTRILRLGYRRGDSAEVAQIELVGSEYDPNAADKGQKAEVKKPTVGGRLRAAAQRLRGKKADAGDGESAEIETKKAKPARAKSKAAKSDTRGKAKTTATPRKAGGS
jgi:large subunit ribosomal protein L17